MGEGLGQFTPPLVDRVDSNKPLSIALEEIAEAKIVVAEVRDPMLMAEEFLSGSEGATTVMSLSDEDGED